MPSWKKVITSGSDAALNSLNVTTSLTASGNIYPTGLGVDRQILKTNGAGNISFGYAEEIVAIVKNVSGGTLQKGTPVHATASGAMGNVVGIIAASASDASTMPATFVLNETLNDGDEGEALSAGFIQGVNTAAFEVGQIVYVGESGGYTGTKPTGSNLIQNLGIVTKVGLTNGAGYVLGAGRSNDLPNIQPGYVWVGNSNSVPTPTATSSIQNVVSASFATSASWAPGGGATFPYTGSAEITGSLGVTGSFSVLDSIDATNKILIGSGPIPGSTEDSVNWDSRTLFDSNGNFSMRWGTLRSLYDANASQSADWNNRLLKFDNGPGDYTVNWNAGILRDTGSNNSVDWQNRITIDTGNKTSINWQNRQLKDSSGNENFNWSSGIKITGSALVSGSLTVTGSLTVSGSSTFTNIGPAQFSGSFGVQGTGTGVAGPFAAIEIDDANFSRKLYDYTAGSASIDFGNRNLLTANGMPAISWDGSVGIYTTNLYNSQTIDSATRGNLYGFNVQGGQTLAESYFDITVMDNDLVYLNTDGQWYQVDQTTNSSTKMLGIAKSVFSQTGSVLIEGDIVVTTGTGYPAVANAGYGLPVYIKQGAGTAMDTTAPVSGYVRLLGHCYYTPYAGSTEWIMKFRPSNEWIEL